MSDTAANPSTNVTPTPTSAPAATTAPGAEPSLAPVRMGFSALLLTVGVALLAMAFVAVSGSRSRRLVAGGSSRNRSVD